MTELKQHVILVPIILQIMPSPIVHKARVMLYVKMLGVLPPPLKWLPFIHSVCFLDAIKLGNERFSHQTNIKVN